MPEYSKPDANGQLVHLERLFLIAQFLTNDVNEAANLVEETYTEASEKGALAGAGSFSSLVEFMMIQAARGRVGPPGSQAEHRLSDNIRDAAARDFMEECVRLVFLSLSDSDRLELWASVESEEKAGDGELEKIALPGEPDPLERFRKKISDLSSPLEAEVFGHHLSRLNVATALRSFWARAFVPAPPTLRSVLESRLRSATRNREPESDRGESRVVNKRSPSRPARMMLYILIVILAAGSGYLISKPGVPEAPSTNILELSISSLETADVSFHSDSPEQVERFIRDRFGWRLSTPVISGATLSGLSMSVVAENVEVPVLIFIDEADGAVIPIVAYTYGFFQRNRTRFALPSGTLRQIQQPSGFDIHELVDKTAIVWRDKDDIFAAFVVEGGQEFQARVSRDS